MSIVQAPAHELTIEQVLQAWQTLAHGTCTMELRQRLLWV